MPASNSGDQMTRSGTTVVAARSFDVFKIEGYSRAFHSLSARPSFNSLPFRAGGRTWCTIFRPRGSLDNTDSISFAIQLVDAVDEAVTAVATFTLLDQGGMPVHIYTQTTRAKTLGEPGKDRFIECEKFMKRRDLERSEYLEDDCFSIRVHVHIVKEAPSVVVPPSDIHRHIGSLLPIKEGTDVEFRVGEETFAAHRLLLGARSPVFQAELFGPMLEGAATNIIRIDDMEPQVFRALLTFVYTDTWPEIDEEDDETAMAQHLLVAADRYGLERLKQMCEDRLCDRIDARSAATTLALAEQHGCPGLKKACFEFVLSSTKSLASVIEAEDFEYLARSCPAMVKEINSRIFLTGDPENAKSDELFRGMPLFRGSTTSMLSAAISDPPAQTVSVKAYHVLKIDGFSMTCEALRDIGFIDSCPFRAGGYNWRVSVRPKQTRPANTDSVSIFLVLADVVHEKVMAQATFSLLDRDERPVPPYSKTTSMVNLSKQGSVRFHTFIRRERLERTGLLKDDCFTVRTDIHTVKTLPPTTVVPPPPGMQKNLGDLLSNKEGMDVEFRVAGETFGAHRLVLAARSPVFQSELRVSANNGSTVNVVEIHDMDAQVFKALLSFIYTDTWPDTDGEVDEFSMAQRLLGAADRYGMQRLKLMCEGKLWNHIDTCCAATLLELAEKHHCGGLKKACFEFLCSSSTALHAVVETHEFKHLARRYPIIIQELTSDIHARNQEKGAGSGWNLESHKNCIETPVTHVLQLKTELLLNIGLLFAA